MDIEHLYITVQGKFLDDPWRAKVIDAAIDWNGNVDEFVEQFVNPDPYERILWLATVERRRAYLPRRRGRFNDLTADAQRNEAKDILVAVREYPQRYAVEAHRFS